MVHISFCDAVNMIELVEKVYVINGLDYFMSSVLGETRNDRILCQDNTNVILSHYSSCTRIILATYNDHYVLFHSVFDQTPPLSHCPSRLFGHESDQISNP